MNRFFALIFAGVLLLSAAQNSSTSDKSMEAARLNNLGAAYMNQQLFEKGLKNFQDAAALDPKLEIAKLNQGIAQLNLTRIDPARQLLEEAVKRRPEDPNAWFNLGLLYKNILRMPIPGIFWALPTRRASNIRRRLTPFSTRSS